MTFQEAIGACLRQYAEFTGRARRSEYWWFVLFTSIVSGAVSGFGDPIRSLVSAAFWLPGLAVAVRRLHDVGRSGWNLLWVLTIVGVVPVIVWLTTDSDPAENAYGPPPPSLR
jgi:uncharacterized membrane protein YhaH (DUF805 family)